MPLTYINALCCVEISSTAKARTSLPYYIDSANCLHAHLTGATLNAITGKRAKHQGVSTSEAKGMGGECMMLGHSAGRRVEPRPE